MRPERHAPRRAKLFNPFVKRRHKLHPSSFHTPAVMRAAAPFSTRSAGWVPAIILRIPIGERPPWSSNLSPQRAPMEAGAPQFTPPLAPAMGLDGLQERQPRACAAAACRQGYHHRRCTSTAAFPMASFSACPPAGDKSRTRQPRPGFALPASTRSGQYAPHDLHSWDQGFVGLPTLQLQFLSFKFLPFDP
jgi:hypothetical protein